MRLRFLVPAVLALAASAAEPMTSTAWDVRKESEELIEDIDRHRADPGELVARALHLMEGHGSDLIAAGPTTSAPLAAVLTERLAAAGLGARLAEAAAPGADRRLGELLAERAPAAGLAAFARSVPGTPAAAKAWRLAADLAWDRGDLRLYRDASAMAKEGEDPQRRLRVATAIGLASEAAAEVPAGLDSLEQMWRIAENNQPVAAATEAPAQERLRFRRRILVDDQGNAKRPEGSRGIARCGDGAIAISDGRSLVVIDHLVGQPIGRRINLGEVPLPAHCARPVPVAGGAVAAGVSSEGHALLVCVSAAGNEAWRSLSTQAATVSVSAPVADGAMTYLAYRTRPGDHSELRVMAVRTRDGAPLWDTAIANLAGNRWGDDESFAPAVAIHARGVVVLANNGLLALVGSDGGVRRVWTYPVRPVEFGPSGPRNSRRGLAAGDGQTAVATPYDHPGMVLILGPDDTAPRAYRGDNADGDVLAVQGGEALLAGRQVALLSLADLKVRWAAPLRLLEPQGSLGANSVLVSGNDQICLIDRKDGTCRPGRALVHPAGVVSRDGVLVLADGDEIRGFGDAASFLARLRSAADAAGSDPRPHAALAAVLAGRGEIDAAIASWRKALDLGAGPEVAERAARLLRGRIDAGGPVATAALADLARLAGGLPALSAELPLWRARLAEAAGDRQRAAGEYQAALQANDHAVPMPDGLSVSLRLLAGFGAARCGGGAAPAIDAVTATPAASPATAWQLPLRTRGAALVAGGIVTAYADGLLRAWNLADGKELWRRRPQRALLGVSERPGRQAKPADGVPVNVLPGSSADAAGLKSGDVLLGLNGQELHTFVGDLRPAVLALGPGADFTFSVLRGADKLTIRGALGGEPVEPLACDGKVLLARAVNALSPGQAEPRFFAIDAATGQELWAHTLAADEEQLAGARPILAAGGVVMATDGPDLVGLATAGAASGSRLWTRQGRADLLARVRPIGRCAWMVGSGGEGVLMDPADGTELAVIPQVDPEAIPSLASDALAVREADGRMAVWDLAHGRLRSRGSAPATPLALRGGGALVVDARNRAAVVDSGTGNVRRVIGDDIVESWACGPQDAFLALVAPDRRRLVAVALDGMSPRWSLDLPAGVEIAALTPWRDGLVATVRDGATTWALLVGGDGLPAGTSGWSDAVPPGDQAAVSNRCVLPAGAGAVVVSGEGLRAMLAGLPAPPPGLKALDLGSEGGVRDQLAAKAGQLAWRDVPGGRLALARSGFRLVVCMQAVAAPAAPDKPKRVHTVAKGETLGDISQAELGSSKHWRRIIEANPGLDPARLQVGQVLTLPDLAADDAKRTGGLTLRIADLSGPLIRDASLGGIAENGMRTFVPGSWNLAEAWVMPGQPSTSCSVWAPLPSRPPGAPLAVLAGNGDAGGSLPWWLAAGWLRVLDPP